MNTRFLRLVAALSGLFLVSTAHAQLVRKSVPANRLDSRRAGASATVTGGVVTGITVRNGGTYTAATLVMIAVAAGIKLLLAHFSFAGFTRSLSCALRGFRISKNLSSPFPLFCQL